ncbi:MAG: tetratricopeptide repeat protein [Acidobacteriota bacterium]|nr:MAG: tetratricopeptide repeat protein [Acidobacteriota bacterium]
MPRPSGALTIDGGAPTAQRLLLVALLAVVPYLLLPQSPLLLDALRTISDNPAVTKEPLGSLFLVDFWGVPLDAPHATGSYRPLVSLSWALQVRAFGPSPRVLHLTDMGLHALGAVLVTLLIARWARSSRWAVTAGALFAVHPVLSEAVSSIVGRADLMASLALFGALLIHTRAPAGTTRWLPAIATVALLAIALLCKEYAVAFPFLLVIVDVALAKGGRGRPPREQVAVWVGSFVVLSAYLAFRWMMIGAVGSVPMLGEGDHPLVGQPLSVRWATALWMFVHAARLMVLPIGLSAFHQGYGALSIASSLADPRALAGAALLAALAGCGLFALRNQRDPVPAIAASLFFFPLAPSLNTVSIAGVLLAERYFYVPMAGVALLVSWLLTRLVTSQKIARVAVWSVVGIAVLLTALTVDRVADWRSSESLVRATLAWYPNSAVGWQILGHRLGLDGQDGEAAEAFEQSLAVNDRSPKVWRNYAVALLRLGRYREAADAFRRCLQLSPPDLAPLWRGLGAAELEAGDIGAAVAALRRAHELAPEDGRASMLLARALLREAQRHTLAGETQDAVALVEEAAALEALPPEGWFLAGLVLVRAGEQDKGAVLVDRALSEDPELLRKKHRAALELNEKGRYDEAAEQYREIVTARPDHWPSWFNLGRSLLLAGRSAEAIAPLEAGLELRDDAGARELLARARAESRHERSEPQ